MCRVALPVVSVLRGSGVVGAWFVGLVGFAFVLGSACCVVAAGGCSFVVAPCWVAWGPVGVVLAFCVAVPVGVVGGVAGGRVAFVVGGVSFCAAEVFCLVGCWLSALIRAVLLSGARSVVGARPFFFMRLQPTGTEEMTACRFSLVK